MKDVVATHERTLGVLNRCPHRRTCETCDYHLYDSLGQQRPKPDPACVAEVEARATAAEHTAAVLRAALDKYARHRYDCGSRPGDACTCGLDALLTRY